MKKEILVIGLVLILTGLLSGCVENDTSLIGTTHYKEGLLIGSEFHRGWFVVSGVDIYFDDGEMVRINADSDNITLDSLNAFLNYHEGSEIEIIYHYSSTSLRWTYCDSINIKRGV